MRVSQITQQNQYKASFKNSVISKPTKQTRTVEFQSIPKTLLAGSALVGYLSYLIYFKKPQKMAQVVNDIPVSETVLTYTEKLANSLSEYLKKEILPESLSSVISGKDLLKELTTLKKENYIASAKNIENGTFLADLHSHSNYSDGAGDVATIMNQVAQYADRVNQKTGKKFIYALTDHDICNGVKEALKIIAEKPEKFKNVKFVTGIEMSYSAKSDISHNPFEIPEVLIYGFNPFDKNITSYLKSVYQKRKNMVQAFIQDLNIKYGYADFSYNEFIKIFKINSEFLMPNLRWKVHHYGQTKNAVAGLANEQGKDKSMLYEEIMSKTQGERLSLWDLRNQKLVPDSYGDDPYITQLCKEKYGTREENGKIYYVAENNFAEIVEAFNAGDDTFMALAHPYYLTEKMSNPQKHIEELIQLSKGQLKASESFHQAYGKIDVQKIEEFNRSLQQNNFYEFGGRDNHNKDWLKL